MRSFPDNSDLLPWPHITSSCHFPSFSAELFSPSPTTFLFLPSSFYHHFTLVFLHNQWTSCELEGNSYLTLWSHGVPQYLQKRQVQISSQSVSSVLIFLLSFVKGYLIVKGADDSSVFSLSSVRLFTFINVLHWRFNVAESGKTL